MKKYILILLLASFPSVTAGRGDVIFEGKPPENSRTIERGVRRDELTADSVRALLVNDGYLDAVVHTEKGRFIVNAYDRSLLQNVLWLNDSSSQSDIRLPFTGENLEKVIDLRVSNDRNAGYFYSTATVRKVSREGNDVSVEILLNSGPRLFVSGSIYHGLSRTAPDLIDRYLSLDSGDVIVEKKLRDSERRAAEIPFVLFTPPVNVRPLPGYTRADLEYNFMEKKQVLISGGAGYVPGASSSLVWNLDLAFQNLFGGGRRARFLSERREEQKQILDITYRQPLFVFGVGDVGFDVATRDYRDQFYEFSLSTDYRTRLSNSFSAGLRLGWRSVEPSTNDPSYNAFASNFTIESSTVDNTFNPSSGTSLAWTISFSYRRYSDDSLAARPVRTGFNETRTMVKAQWYQRLKASLIGHVRLEFLGLQTAEELPPVSELFLIGGPPAIRGFRNEQFAAIRTAYGTLEPHVRFDSGYLFVFYDGAYINNRIRSVAGEVVTEEFFRNSYGLGAAIVDRGRTVKLAVGWNPELPFDQPRLSLEFSSEI